MLTFDLSSTCPLSWLTEFLISKTHEVLSEPFWEDKSTQAWAKSTSSSATCPAFKTRCSGASPDSLTFHFQSCLCAYIPHATHPHWCFNSTFTHLWEEDIRGSFSIFAFQWWQEHDVLAGGFEHKAQLCGSGWMHNSLP